MYFETKDLIVDRLTTEDAARFHEICTKHFVVKWMNDWEMNIDQVENLVNYFIEGYKVNQPEKHPLVMAVRLKNTRQLIGQCGFGAKDKLGGDVEICYFIDETYSNKGYMSQVVEDAIKYYFDTYKKIYLSAMVEEGNGSSYKILMKNGFEFYLVDDDTGELESHYRLYNKDKYMGG